MKKQMLLLSWMCVGQTKAYIVNVVSEMCNCTNPDEFGIAPHDNQIPYDRACRDG